MKRERDGESGSLTEREGKLNGSGLQEVESREREREDSERGGERRRIEGENRKYKETEG